ncbi:MAG TPA: nicotinate phosphoribosyltransferase [Acidimicrobiales bacterium]|nr:nicotinate phosphoribosyltransferase [Acidimicrobiales bacterium]
MTRALTTDLYELKMAGSYLARDMGELATFSLFIRTLPPSRGFLVAAGLADCLSYLQDLAFDDEDLAWLEQLLPGPMVERFRGLRFTGDVHAVPEGRIVFANEPILEVTAPLPEAQLVETYLLNQVTYQSAIATKAARCQIAAGDMELVDFSLRRTHGTEAALAVARLSAMAGFVGTSNVAAARRFGLAVSGTMAHSYVEAFPTEGEAFSAFAEDFPDDVTFLVDTFDTLAGVDTAIGLIRRTELAGRVGVRIDSGDLPELARRTRDRLDDAGLGHVRIFVSGGLDEHSLEALRHRGAPVDAAGVGTHMGVSADVPVLDSAYKLVSYAGRPVRKLSEGKASLPGAKQVWRTPAGGDVLGLRHEPAPSGAEPLLVEVMRGGRCTGEPDSLERARRRLRRDLDALPPPARHLTRPVAPAVRLSEELLRLSGGRAR